MGEPAQEARSCGRIAVAAFVYAAVALVVYGPALGGAFVSDDIGYVSGNPWIQSLDAAHVAAILDPTGPVAAHTANYAPVHMLLHAAAWSAFGADTTGHHVVNVLVHALASALLVALFVRTGVAFAVAAGAGAIFLLHPANVEAVAWIFQLKTVAALALACAALLLEPRRPGAALAVFALALLTKIQAAFALPVAAVWVALDRPRAAPRRPRRTRALWLCGWALVLALVLVPEMLAFERLGHAGATAPGGIVERARFSLALVGRYLAMAATSWGVSAFHQPDPPARWGDGWVLLGAAGSALLALRALLALARREAEAGYWAWAAGGFLPVSQVLPFLYPMADRYLYYVLPGLLGALALAFARPLDRALARPRGRLVLAVAALALLAGFAARSHARAAVWRSDATLAIDAARHYPHGIPAQRLAALRAARRGDVEGAVAALRAAAARGFDRFMDLERDPSFAAMRSDPRFVAVVHEIAGTWIARVEQRLDPTTQELLVLGQAYRTRGEWERAIDCLERAVAKGGPGAEQARLELVATRAAARRAGAPRPAAAPEADDGRAAR